MFKVLYSDYKFYSKFQMLKKEYFQKKISKTLKKRKQLNILTKVKFLNYKLPLKKKTILFSIPISIGHKKNQF